MKDYIIYFSDGTDTTGKAINKTEMRKQANIYIRAWQLDCCVSRIEEVNKNKWTKHLFLLCYVKYKISILFYIYQKWIIKLKF